MIRSWQVVAHADGVSAIASARCAQDGRVIRVVGRARRGEYRDSKILVEKLLLAWLRWEESKSR